MEASARKRVCRACLSEARDQARQLVANTSFAHSESMCAVAARRLNIWYDRECDFLEVIFEYRAVHFRETDNGQVMEKRMVKIK